MPASNSVRRAPAKPQQLPVTDPAEAEWQAAFSDALRALPPGTVIQKTDYYFLDPSLSVRLPGEAGGQNNDFPAK